MATEMVRLAEDDAMLEIARFPKNSPGALRGYNEIQRWPSRSCLHSPEKIRADHITMGAAMNRLFIFLVISQPTTKQNVRRWLSSPQ
jgi:hypothetical protein